MNFATLFMVVALLSAFGPDAAHEAPAPVENVRYTLGLLERGPTWTSERTPHTDSIQTGHMANIGRMSRLGVLAAAGPFAGSGSLRGSFVWEPGTPDIDSLLAGDPAIASGRLECKRYDWLAPPGLGKDYQRRLAERGTEAQGMPDSMLTYGVVLLHRGPHYDSNPSLAVRKLMSQHHTYTEKLRAAGRLIFAGAIEGTGDLRGVLVMMGDSTAVSRAIASDPAVRAKRFTPQVLTWWNAWGTIPGH